MYGYITIGQIATLLDKQSILAIRQACNTRRPYDEKLINVLYIDTLKPMDEWYRTT